MRKVYFVLILILLLIIFLAREFLTTIGLGLLTMLNVSVQEKISGKLLLAYKYSIEIGDKQEIYTEFINTGTKGLTVKIEITIYGYLNNTLKPLAYYYDTTVPVGLGMRRGFRVSFVPPNTGLYYIKAKASYDTRILETWGAFSVVYPQPEIIPIFEPITGPPAIPSAPTVGLPELSLEYPDSVVSYPGEKRLINISVKNIGNAPAQTLQIYISTSSLIDVSVSPKQIPILKPNESTIFVISIEIPKTIETGNYPLEFEVITLEGVKKRGEISIKVSSIVLPEEEDISIKILSYELMILEIQQKINSAFLEGYDVRIANETLNMARFSLENAKDYFKSGRMQDAKKELTKVENYIQEALLQLSSATLYVYRPFAFLWWIIILIILLIALIFLIIWYLKRRAERRPKLLERLEET
ncbi:MAG: NEW3 domain-containing protein [Candidatus Aenigmatarchaeota archaeon]